MKAPARREILAALPPAALPAVEALLAAARECDASVLLVGGPVRDLLLARGVRDVDLVVEGGPGRGARELADSADLGGARLIEHGRFRTLRVETPECVVDLATVRSESYSHPGALPRVAPGTLEQDLRRRDFTVNALALPLSPTARRRHPPLVDAAAGAHDLARGALRVFHARSFHDDPTRALRGARLAARLGFRLSRSSRTALHDALRDGAFGNVAGERFRREFAKLFDDARLGVDPARALRLLAEWHVLPGLEPGLGVSRAAMAALRRLGRALADPPWAARQLRPWVPGLAVWLAPLDATLRRRTLARLAVRGALGQRVGSFPKQQRELLQALRGSRGRGAADALLGPLDEEFLHALYACADAPLRQRITRYAREDRPRRTPVTGTDLLELGLSGPAVGRALTRVRAAFLDGGVRSRDEVLALAREVGRGRTPSRSGGRRRR